MNHLVELWSEKQSFWLDFIRRELITSGALKKYVEEDGLRGMTSNPTIFEKAITAGDDYDGEIKSMARQKKSNEQIFDAIAAKDIGMATRILEPVYRSSNGTDGFVSLEVQPKFANNTADTVMEAKRLAQLVKRPNLMIKVPGTAAGVPAVEELTAAGFNINITLLFSLNDYKVVLEAYLRGLERRVKRGAPISKIASVASFFVSRVDTIIDKQLDAFISAGGEKADASKKLLHRAAIANARLAYAHYQSVTASDRWLKLKAKGAQAQRLLWASTGTKDKRLSDVVYINELIGPDTVNTMPPQTADAFRDHGFVAPTLARGVDEAKADIASLASLGIDFEASLRQLQLEGIKSFEASFDGLLRGIGAKREILLGTESARVTFELGRYTQEWKNALKRQDQEKWVERVWQKDATLWKNEEAHKIIIKNSLGWLTVTSEVRRRLAQVNDIVADVRKAKFTHALLLGMGGSSLCPEVLRLTFGKKAGYPDLAILDSTEPASVKSRAARAKPEKTLFIVSSKSGSTTEPNAFLAYFYEQVRKKKGAKAGDNFIAITDPGTSMEKTARDKKFRHVVLNPPDIGGRYSALSFFGMLPAALMGINVRELLDSATSMADATSAFVTASKNPGAQLGAALGVLAAAKRNKVTFLLSKDIASFATWAEQLIAESTGKEGKGIVPVESEPAVPADVYGSDRVFVAIETRPDPKIAATLRAVKKAGHPTIRIHVPAKVDIAAEFFRWEFATAIAGAWIGIDAFDQPNVQESKDLTREYLERYRDTGNLTEATPVLEDGGVAVFSMNGTGTGPTLEETIRRLLDQTRPGDYVAILAYIERNARNEAALQAIRKNILVARHVATTIGFGPRFLHSTGQLHKGGDNNGVFIQITADDDLDVPVPGQAYSFSVLKEAQALGDMSALAKHHRRALRLHLHDLDKGLAALQKVVAQVTAKVVS